MQIIAIMVFVVVAVVSSIPGSFFLSSTFLTLWSGFRQYNVTTLFFNVRHFRGCDLAFMLCEWRSTTKLRDRATKKRMNWDSVGIWMIINLIIFFVLSRLPSHRNGHIIMTFFDQRPIKKKKQKTSCETSNSAIHNGTHQICAHHHTFSIRFFLFSLLFRIGFVCRNN